MAPSYKFAVIRLAPDDGRDERLNVGIVVFNEASLDVRAPARLDKVKAISAAADTRALRDLIDSLAIHSMAMLATPVSSKRRDVRFVTGANFDLGSDPSPPTARIGWRGDTFRLTDRSAGLDNRHRDTTGEISRKHGNTLVRTLRKIYGQSFAADQPETAKLSDVLRKLNESSLSQLRHDHETGRLDEQIAKAS